MNWKMQNQSPSFTKNKMFVISYVWFGCLPVQCFHEIFSKSYYQLATRWSIDPMNEISIFLLIMSLIIMTILREAKISERHLLVFTKRPFLQKLLYGSPIFNLHSRFSQQSQAQFYIQLVYKPHFGTWILLGFGRLGSSGQ